MTDMENAEATPRIGRVRRTVLAVAGITAMAGTVMVLTSLGSGASAAPAAAVDPKVTLCHRTDSETNPYVQITIAAAGAFHGHFKQHQGDVWFPGHPKEPKWGDIIPPSVWNGNAFQENWDAAGQAIFNNGCNPVTVVTSTPPVTSEPPTSSEPVSNPPSTVTTSASTSTSSSASISASSSASLPPATSTTAATSVGPIPSGVSAGLHTAVSGAGVKAWGTILMLLGGAAGLAAGLWPTRRRAH